MSSALILGNSQAEGAGTILKNILKLRGDTVKFLAKHGAASKELLNLYKNNVTSNDKFDLIVIFNWDTRLINELLDAVHQNASDSAQIIWYGCPPATHITDTALAKKVFGSKVTGPEYWLTSGYAAEREKFNTDLKNILPKDVIYIDYRDLEIPDKTEQSVTGVMFPNLPDGIHITKTIAKAMFAAPNWPTASTTEIDKANLSSFVTPVLIGTGIFASAVVIYEIGKMFHKFLVKK